jgi:gliding motility-associated-like protein
MFILNDTSNLVLNIIDSIPTNCSYTCDGSITIQATNGYIPYNYQWGIGVNDSTIINQCIGSYMVIVTDAQNCHHIDIFDVTGPDELIAVVDSITPVGCNGDCNGEIFINPIGGTPAYTYEWSTTETVNNLTNLCTGTYILTLTDSHSCKDTISVDLIQPTALALNINNIVNVNCFGDSTGTANAFATGGVPPYSFEWSNGQTDSTTVNLAAGTYYVTVTDLGHCTITDSITITQGDSLFLSINNLINPACAICNGGISIIANGGTPGYTYQWDANAGNSTNSSITALCANTYSVTVTDTLGCFTDSVIILNDTSNINLIVIDSTMTSCSYNCDGSITLTASNGVLPYTWEWSTSDNDSTISNQCVGTYQVTLTDAQNCKEIRDFEITGPTELIATIDTIIQSNCFGQCNAEIITSAIGGTPNYTYLWSNGETTSHITNLCAGNYRLILTDANNCKDTLDTLIHVPDQIILTFNNTNPLCNFGSGDGAINLTVNGGTPGYTYNWSTTETTQDIANIDGGWYSVVVTDTLGCFVLDSSFVSSGITMTALADSDITVCTLDTVQIFGSGLSSDGNAFTYNWYPTTNMSDSTVLNPFVTVTDSTYYYFEIHHTNGICIAIDSVLVATYPTIPIDAGENQIIPYEASTQITAIGGGQYSTYTWFPNNNLETPNDSSSIVSGLTQTTTYNIIVVSEFGCIQTDSVKITIVPELIIPNGITPNGDGINDTWVIDFIELYPNVTVEIFNRWGEKLFYSEGYEPNDRWDGNYKGKRLPTGTYYYIILLNDDIHNEPFTGPITLVR